jgi:TRAP-type transport system small permease protein
MQATPAAAAPQAGPRAFRWYTTLCAGLARASLMLAVALLIGIIVCVQWQVVGRYIFNDTPTWAEALALLLVLYMTSLGVAVGVRDAGHIGLESLATLLPIEWQQKLAIVVHLLVATFGFLMAKSGWLWAAGKWNEKKPMLGVPEGADYVPLVVAGILIVLFCAEHIIALVRGHEVAPAWN